MYERLETMGSDAAEAQASKILAGLGFTNDMQGCATRWKKTLVVVSHDQDFLNTVCAEIIHLHDLKLHFYHGNFDDFEGGYEQRRKEINKKFEIYDKQIKAAKRSGNQAQHDKVKDRVKAPQKWQDYSVKFHFPEPTELTPPLLQLIEVSFSYPNREDFRLSNVDVGINMGPGLLLWGLMGLQNLHCLISSQVIWFLLKVKFAGVGGRGLVGTQKHFVDLLTMDETPAQYLLRLHPDQEGLSKQEAKSCVVFASISMSKPHILLLDEPTNHLDVQSIDALDEFTGGVVLVSHNSRLISRVCEDKERSEIWVVEDGTVQSFPGTFEEHKEELLIEIKAEVDE
ncbi:P-loop containing nucleoside triphosphate hydrolase [Trema orientale]|uniref:P-loop containing nucleoside triphosphate hydrolase n=1 Tax=Trema orientale TaxID=63057 RepID=A0A2P5AJT5_TREOI|nr:P-loop containing nucleoside triphosphate hydrolase [Trema orientale]